MSKITPYTPRPFCELCIIWFATPAELTTHLDTDWAHTPHPCSTCQSRFKTLLDLQKHQLLECLDTKRERNEGFCERCVVWCEGGKVGLERHRREEGCSLGSDRDGDGDYDDEQNEEREDARRRERKRRRTENTNGTGKGKGKERAVSPLVSSCSGWDSASDSDNSGHPLPPLRRPNRFQPATSEDITSDEEDGDLTHTTTTATANSERKSTAPITTASTTTTPTTPPSRGSINGDANSSHVHNQDRDHVIGSPSTRTSTVASKAGDWEEDSDTSSCTLAGTGGSDYDDDDENDSDW